MFIERLRREDRIIPIQPETNIERGDILVLYDRRGGPHFGPRIIQWTTRAARLIRLPVSSSRTVKLRDGPSANWPAGHRVVA
jgi:hypothetical protein